MFKLDPSELEVLEACDSGKLKPSAGKAELQRVRTAARATARKDKCVKIRLSTASLLDIQARALAGRHAVSDLDRQRAAQAGGRQAGR